jgi:hypothetical protein
MKAEHRKELQTNSLADLLGRMLQGRQTSSGLPWFKIFLGVFVCLVLVVVWWVLGNRARNFSEAWEKVDLGTSKALQEVQAEMPGSKQAEAALYIDGFKGVWETIKLFGSGQKGQGEQAKNLVENALVPHYVKLAEIAKDDPEHLAEAKYNLFVCRETLAAIDIKNLDEAKKELEELSTGDLAATAYGQLAKKRLEQYNNPAQYSSIVAFYMEFRRQLQ